MHAAFRALPRGVRQAGSASGLGMRVLGMGIRLAGSTRGSACRIGALSVHRDSETKKPRKGSPCAASFVSPVFRSSLNPPYPLPASALSAPFLSLPAFPCSPVSGLSDFSVFGPILLAGPPDCRTAGLFLCAGLVAQWLGSVRADACRQCGIVKRFGLKMHRIGLWFGAFGGTA